MRLGFTLAPLLACAFVTGCLAHAYEIDPAELQRLVALPVEDRGEEVRVTQQTSFSSDVRDEDLDNLPSAVLFVELEASGERPAHRHVQRHHADRDEEGPAEEALAVIVAAAAVASLAVVTVAATEGARFDGWLAAPPAQPLLLIAESGGRRWSRLDALTPADLRGVERAVMPELDSELDRQRRAPLDRRGLVYQLEFGASQLASGWDGSTLGVAGRAALGVMPQQHFGVLIGGAFAAARTPALQGAPGDSPRDDELSVDYRAFLQLEYWPLRVGRRLHLGAFGEVGTGGALRDEPFANRSVSGLTAGAGVALQLDASTRLAATLRLGAFWLPSIDAGSTFLAPDGYRVASALTLGVSVY
jgi:hypothetical protein